SRRNREFSVSSSPTPRLTGTAPAGCPESLPLRLSNIQFHTLDCGIPSRLAAVVPPIDSASLTASILNSSVYCRFGTNCLLPISSSVHQKSTIFLVYVKPGQ